MRRAAVYWVALAALVLAAAAVWLSRTSGTPDAIDTSERAHAREAILTQGKKLYSQHDEELVIRHFFDDRREGFFVDVGAYHWKRSSTTLYLEKHLGWTGFAIDAQAGVAKGYARNRPGSRFFNYIITDHSGTEDSLYIAGPVSSTKPTHADELLRLAGKDTSELPAIESRRTVLVPTMTLNELLDEHGIRKIDFLSLDIEQGEPAALAGFDIERFQPELVCVEAFPPVRSRLSEYFERHGYERIDAYVDYDLNWYFRRKDPSVDR
jgi:FkbM family methyltransferase